MKRNMYDRNLVLLSHIINECNYLMDNIYDLEIEYYLDNETFKRSSARSIEIIGEAVKNIDSDFKIKYNQIEWKKIAGMRDIVIHNYIGVDYYIIYNVVKNGIPDLIENINLIINELKQ